MDPDIPVTVSLTGPEAELLDRAIDNFTSPIPESRPDFVLACVRYGLLALAEEGILNLEVEGEIPGFVAWYRDVVKHRTSGDTHSPCL